MRPLEHPPFLFFGAALRLLVDSTNQIPDFEQLNRKFDDVVIKLGPDVNLRSRWRSLGLCLSLCSAFERHGHGLFDDPSLMGTVGLNPIAAQRLLRACGYVSLPRFAPGARRIVCRERVREAAFRGRTLADIARAEGVTPQAISVAIRPYVRQRRDVVDWLARHEITMYAKEADASAIVCDPEAKTPVTITSESELWMTPIVAISSQPGRLLSSAGLIQSEAEESPVT